MAKQLLVFIFSLTFLAPALSIYKSKQKPNLLSKTVENSITCDFSIHKKGPNGQTVSGQRENYRSYDEVLKAIQKVSGASLDDEIYYKIKCEPITGNCLQVVNCTLSSDEPGFQPYPIIDDYGCSLEESLFKNVNVRQKSVKMQGVSLFPVSE